MNNEFKSCKNFSTLASNREKRERLDYIESYFEAIFFPTKRKNEARKPQI